MLYSSCSSEHSHTYLTQVINRPLNMGVKRSGPEPIEVTPQPTEAADPVDANHADALRALMEFYESGEVLDEEESEVALMIQLSGMVQDVTGSED